MKPFETILEAYNAYKNMPVATIEARAQAINAEIQANANADVAAYGIELEGLERVLEEKQGQTEARAQAPANVEHTAANSATDDKAATPEYRSAFFKHLQGRDLTTAERTAFEAVNAEKRSGDAFNTLTNAAAVIPTTTLNEVISKARKQGGIMGIARAFNMPANVSIPVATPGNAAQWHVEGQAVETEQASTVPVVFGAYEIMKVLSISAATRTMSIAAFESYLVDELTASVMATLAKGMVDGTGTAQATGVLTGITWTTTGDDANAIEVAANADLGFADILKAIAMLKRGYSNGAKFVMNNATLYSDVYAIHDEVNRPVYLADLVNGGPGRILGFEVVVDDYMPDHDILFGNFGYYGYNLPSGIALDVSRESSFKSGLIDYRALAIADAKPIIGDAFVKITKASE